MGESISQNKKTSIFILTFVVYCLVNFLQASTVLGTWNFDKLFTDSLLFGLGYLLIDLLGGDVIDFVRTGLRLFGIIKRNDNTK